MTHRHLATTPSTMEEARRLLAEGDTETTLITASEQTSGRGRQGATWITFPFPHALAATFIVRESRPLPHLSLIVSLALHTALTQNLPHGLRVTGDDLRIKWPNDLLFKGKKVAGILIESHPTPTGPVYLIGFGLNLFPPCQIPENFPGTFLFPENPDPETWRPGDQATSLPESLTTCILTQIQLYKAEGWSALHHNYLRACSTIGQPARWKRAGKQDLTGIARGLTKDGHLELETDDGQTHIIHSGEIVEVTTPSIS